MLDGCNKQINYKLYILFYLEMSYFHQE